MEKENITWKMARNPNKVSSNTSRWLQTAQVKPPTEALIMAAQDQAINTDWCSHHILRIYHQTNVDYAMNIQDAQN